MKILFRCDASIRKGYGHVTRCLALAQNLKRHNCNIYFAMLKSSEHSIKKVEKYYPVLTAVRQNFDYVEWLIKIIKKNKINIFIIDTRDGMNKEQLRTVKVQTKVKVVSIDDPEEKRMEADLLFYPPVPQLSNEMWDEFKGKAYIGWEYVIIKENFNFIENIKKDGVPNLLVMMGATDNDNMTNYVINSLNKNNFNFKVTIIIGSEYPHLETLKDNLKKVSFNFSLHQNPDNIIKIMSKSNVAIASFGQTAYELAALKIPSFYICISEDHHHSATIFEKAKIGKIIGLIDDLTSDKLDDDIYNLLRNNDEINSMTQNLYDIKVSDLSKISKIIIES